MHAQISRIDALEVLDSRGNPTLKVTVYTNRQTKGSAMVPSGASTGEREAVELRDGDKNRFGGKGVLKALENVKRKIAPELIGKNICDQKLIDETMIALDGTPTKAHLGANAILGVSLAAAHAAANTKGLPLYEYLAFDRDFCLPTPMFNILNGGAHADNGLVFQECMIRPIGASTFQEAIEMGATVFHELKKILKAKKYATNVGDEGGFAPDVGSLEEALHLILQAIEKSGYNPGEDITLALDCAASEFFDKKTGRYHLAKHTQEKGLETGELIDFLETLIQKYPIDSIEDALDQNDWRGWEKLTDRLGSKIQLVGDDLLVTNPLYLRKAIQEKSCNAILIKPNQIGTLTETLDTIRLAKAHRFATIISHRSGETEDATLADLAVAFNTHQIKTGSLCRSERTAKYNRLLEIECELGERAHFSGRKK